MRIEKGRVYGLTCDYCGAELAPKKLSVYKKCKNHFCSHKCKGHFRTGENSPNYKKETVGPRQVVVNGKQRFLYQIEVEKYMKRSLRKGERVYFIDGNPFNTDKKNMMVFASFAEMMAYRRGNTTVKPVWSGRSKKECYQPGETWTSAKRPSKKEKLRLKLAQILGRPLTDYEDVGFRDGNRKNESVSNLVLCKKVSKEEKLRLKLAKILGRQLTDDEEVGFRDGDHNNRSVCNLVLVSRRNKVCTC